MSTGPTFENYNFVNFSFCSENEYPITAFSHHIRHQKSNVDSLLADNFFCLYTTHNFTAVTLVGFGRGPDTAECGHCQISNLSACSHPAGWVLYSETFDIGDHTLQTLKIEP